MIVKHWLEKIREGLRVAVQRKRGRLYRHRVWLWTLTIITGYFAVTLVFYCMAKSADLEILEVYFWDESSESVRNLVLVIGGWLGLLAAIIGFVLSGFRTAASNTQAEAALRQNETALRQAELAFESHVTERFTRAVEQLGHEKRAVRLGAIYALERIAKDSPRDRDTIVETLAAYIRELAPWPPLDDAAFEAEKARTGVRPPIDIAAALTVICRLLPDGDPMRGKTDLRYTDLRGLDAPGINLSRMRLHYANLMGADLRYANLMQALLVETILEFAFLEDGTNLSGANMNFAKMSQAKLTWANLQHANLFMANLSGANLMKADLSGAHLYDVDLSGADMSGGDLKEVQALTQKQIDSIRYRRNDPPKNLPEGLALPAPYDG